MTVQFVNNTDETITLAPGEGMSLPYSTARRYEGDVYRVVAERQGDVVDADELQSPLGRELDREYPAANPEGGDD